MCVCGCACACARARARARAGARAGAGAGACACACAGRVRGVRGACVGACVCVCVCLFSFSGKEARFWSCAVGLNREPHTNKTRQQRVSLVSLHVQQGATSSKTKIHPLCPEGMLFGLTGVGAMLENGKHFAMATTSQALVAEILGSRTRSRSTPVKMKSTPKPKIRRPLLLKGGGAREGCCGCVCCHHHRHQHRY